MKAKRKHAIAALAAFAAVGAVVAMLVVVPALATSPNANAKRGQGAGNCSVGAVAGAWGHIATGTLMLPSGPVPFTAVGKAISDAEGNVSGTQTASAGGTIQTNTVKGTRTVNSDCTGTLNVSLYNQAGTLVRTAVWATVYVDHATEMRAIMTSLRLPDGTSVPPIVTLNGKKLLPGRGGE